MYQIIQSFKTGETILETIPAPEVKRGHLNVLKEIEIPLHTLNPKSGLNEIRLRPRYSISIGSEF